MTQENEICKSGLPECFVIMPISDPEGYTSGHFRKVYEDVITVSCEKAGFRAVRADDVKQTNLIHLDVIQKLIESPMAICDLSNRNPNVLFELGLRQAFDKPTVLIQECGTDRIFDISPLRITEYRRELGYREVLEDQDTIAQTIMDTKTATDKGEGVNSIISLLSLSSVATLQEIGNDNSAIMMQVVMSEMNELRSDFRKMMRMNESRDSLRSSRPMDYERLKIDFQKFQTLLQNGAPIEVAKEFYDGLRNQALRYSERSLTGQRREQLEFLLLEAEHIFSKYLSKDEKN